MAAFWVLTWPWLCAHFEKQGDRERENSGVSSSYKDTVPLQLGSYLYNSWNTYFHQEVKLLSHVWLFVIPWTVAYRVPPSVEFFRQEYWNGLPFPSPGDLSKPGIEPRPSTLPVDALPPGATREAQHQWKASQRKLFQCRVRLGSSLQSRIKIKSAFFFFFNPEYHKLNRVWEICILAYISWWKIFISEN